MMIAALVFAGYLITVVLVYALWVGPAFRGETSTIWWADSRLYLDYAVHPYHWSDLVTLSSNVIGPVLLLNFLGFNLVLVLLVNIALLAFVCFLPLRGNRTTNPWMYILLLAMNPMLLFSVTSISKEIPGACGAVFVIQFLRNRKWYYLIPGLVLTGLGRWHQLAVCLLFILLQTRLNPLRHRRRTVILVLIAAISVVYPFARRYGTLDPIYESADLLHAMQSQKAGGVMHTLNVIQEQYGGFCLTVVPKVLLNFVGNVFRFYATLSGTETASYDDLYNTYVVLGHQLAMLVVVTMLFIRRGLRLSSINVYFALFYSILFSMSILVNYRLFFPIYPLLCLELATLRFNKVNARSVAVYRPPGQETSRLDPVTR